MKLMETLKEGDWKFPTIGGFEVEGGHKEHYYSKND
jgi:hypothetical protein